MNLQTFIELYEKGEITEEVIEQMQHFAFEAGDDEIFIVAQIFAALGRVSQAIELAEALFEKYPTETNLKTFLADLYLDMVEDEKALELLAGNEDESDVKVLLLEADMYIAQGLFEVAEEKLKKAMALEPNNELIQLAYAEFYYYIGEVEKALNLYLNLLEYSLGVEINVYERLANCYSQMGEFEKALEQLELSEKYFGNLNTDQLFMRASLAFQLEELTIAKHALQDLKALDPSYDTIYPLLGKIYQNEQDYEKALEMVQEGINYNEYNAELYLLKGKILEETKNLEEARDAYYEALNLDPEDLDAALRSNRICLALEDFEEVIHNVETYEQSGLFDEQFNWDLAISYLELEDYDQAMEKFEQAVIHFGENVDFLFDYAQFLIEEGRRDEAKERLEKILQIDGSLMPARELLENLV